MYEYVFDLEADGLLDTITKIHCLSYSTTDKSEKGTLYTEADIFSFFCMDALFIGHHIIGYDFKALEKIYSIPRPKNYFDTLGMAWYLQPERSEYGLESYGDEYKVPKPKINDWQNLTIQEYTNRCETDVEINRLLYIDLKKKLQEIYS